jgi:hypothetical protein
MSKDTFYFQHDFEPTSDPKMQALIGEYGSSGYGVFWRLIEMLHSNSDHKLPKKQYLFLAIAKQMQASVEQIQAIIDYCITPCELLISDGEFFWSNRVNSNFERRAQLSEIRSIAGKAGANAKQKLAKRSKGKESKVNNIYLSPVEFYKSELEKSLNNQEYKKFVEFLYGKSDKNNEKCENVLSLRKQLKYYEFLKLRSFWSEKLNSKPLRDIVSDMENYKVLRSKYTSFYLTLRKWIDLDQKRQVK